jgi:hypothetical protein
MCLRRAPEKYIAGAALDRAALEPTWTVIFLIQPSVIDVLTFSPLLSGG